MATISLPAVVVPIAGPVIGGLIVADLSWRWVFYINVPLCLAALVLAWRILPDTATDPGRRPLDVPGLALLCPTLAALSYGLSRLGPDGIGAAPVAGTLAAGGLLLAGYAGWALRRKDRALVDVRLLRVRSFGLSAALMLIAGGALFGAMLFLPLFFQRVQGHSALTAGLLLAPQGIGSLLPRTLAGRLTDRIGPRPVVLAGALIAALGTLPFTGAGAHSGPLLLGAALVVRGAGLSTVTIAIMATAFQGLPPERVPDASSAIRIVQQLGGSFGTAVLATILAHARAAHPAAVPAAAFDRTFWWTLAFIAVALIPALALPKHRTAMPTNSDTRVT